MHSTMTRPGRLTLAMSWIVTVGNVTFAAPADPAVCIACHGPDGAGAGIDNVPIIAGIPAAHLEEALFAYQDGARKCEVEPVMCETASRLSEDEVIELAEYYSKMVAVPAGEAGDPALSQAGKRLHDEHCAKCHLAPNDEAAEDALGIPLQGQRSAYLKLALDSYLSGDRETLVPGMAEKLELLDADDIDALINYYASYRP